MRIKCEEVIKKLIGKKDEMLLIGMCFIDNLLYKNCPKDCHKFISYLFKDMTCGLHVVTVYRRYYLDKLTGKHVFLLDDWLKNEIVMYATTSTIIFDANI